MDRTAWGRVWIGQHGAECGQDGVDRTAWGRVWTGQHGAAPNDRSVSIVVCVVHVRFLGEEEVDHRQVP